MSPDKQRTAIAEACGWRDISDWGASGINGRHPAEPWVEVIPDYLTDLNAMNEAEAMIENWERYLINLTAVVFRNLCGTITRGLVRATAAQRAEAFLRALNLWEESK